MALAVRAPRFSAHWINGGDQGRHLSFAEHISRGNWTWSNEYDIVGSNVAGFTQYQPMLYPLLTGVTAFFIGDVQIAGTVVSLTAGVLVTLFAALLALRLGGPLVALLAGSAVAWHPLLINASANRYTEMTYTAALMGSLLALWRALERPTWRRLVAVGLVWAITALARFEGQNLFLLALVFMALRLGPRPTALVLAGYLAVIVPFNLWGAVATPDDPPQINQVVHTLATLRMGGDLFNTPFEIDPEGTITTRVAAQTTSLRQLLQEDGAFFLRRTINNVRPTLNTAAAEILWGGQWIVVLLGGFLILAFDTRHCERRALLGLTLVPLPLFALGTPLDLAPPLTRYFLCVIPLWLIFMAMVAVALAGTVTRTLCPRLGRWSVSGKGMVLGVLMVGATWWGVAHFPPRDQGDMRLGGVPVLRNLAMAQIVRSQPGPPATVAAQIPGFGWMAGARQMILPIGGWAETIQFLRDEEVEYILVDRPRTRHWQHPNAVLTEPEQVMDDLEWIARDPEHWYYLYRVRPHSEPSAEHMGNPLVTYMDTVRRMDPQQFREECGALSPADSHLVAEEFRQTSLQAKNAGDLEGALEILDEGIDMIPTAWLAIGMKAGLLEELGRPREAIAAWATAVSLARGEGDRDLWMVAREHLDALDVTMAEALAQGEAHLWQCHRVAQSIEREHSQEALAVWDHVLQLGPPHVEYQLGRCRCLMRLNRSEEALEAAQLASDLDPDHPWAELYLGNALAALDRVEEAREHWEQVLRMEDAAGVHRLATERLEQNPVL